MRFSKDSQKNKYDCLVINLGMNSAQEFIHVLMSFVSSSFFLSKPQQNQKEAEKLG